MQSAKTEIYEASKFLDKLNQLENKLKPLIEKLTNKALTLVANEEDPYMPMYRIDKIFSAKPEEAPIEAIREAFKLYFMNALESDDFDKSFFRFLLKRLETVKDDLAVEYCFKILRLQPQETAAVLQYFENVEAFEYTETEIIDFLNSEDCIYSYQNYQIIEWICNLNLIVQPSEKLISCIHRFIWGKMDIPFYLRSICWYFLDKYGSIYDLERAKNSYCDASSSLGQCDIICAINRLEDDRRNDFFRRINKESDMHSRAVRYANKVNKKNS